ncbi:RND family transporter [Myxococcota bacterium]
MLSVLTEFVLRRPALVIVTTVVLTALAGSGMRFLYPDTDVTRDLPQRIPAKKLYDRIDELFPAKEMVIVGIADKNLFTVDGITRLDRLTRSTERLGEVQSVLSPTNARIISATADGMEVREAADPLPHTQAEADTFRRKLFDQPLLVGSLVSDDAQAVTMMVFIKAGVRDADAAEKIIEIANDPEASQGFRLDVTGRAAATYWSKVLMGRDMGMLSMTAVLVVVALLIIIFRSFRGVLLPLAVVISAVIWTLGLMGFVGQPITHSTEILPILLIAIGVADGIHILKGFYSRSRGAPDARTAVRKTMRDLNRPVVLTSITTAVGFLALNTSGIESIMWLGGLTAFGVIIAMLFSITFLPAVLCVLRLPTARPSSDRSSDRGRFVTIESVAARYGSFLTRRRRAVGLAIIAIVAAASFGATQVRSEFSNLSNFRPDHPFRIATERVNEHFASASVLTVVIEGGEPDAIKDPVVLEKMDALEQHILAQEHVGSLQSITGFIKQMHRVMHGGAREEYRLPRETERERGIEIVEIDDREQEQQVEFDVPGKELVAQYLALYEMSGKPGDFANAVTYDYSTARINVLVDSDRATVLTDLHHAVRGFINEKLGGLPAELTGMAELIRAVNDMVVTGQAWSIATSLLLVFLITAVMFRSAVLGLFSTLPLFFSLFLNFGTMGLGGIPLNIMTMATSSVAVGVGIDYAIHFVHRYQQERLSGHDYGEAVVATLRASGVAIFFNALTVAAGFFALFFSEFRGVSHMGLLIALTMITSAFAALTILPAIFVTTRPRAFPAPSQSSAEVS